jgi:hypothetical protein
VHCNADMGVSCFTSTPSSCSGLTGTSAAAAVVQELRKQNPQLMQQISQNQAEFMRMVMEAPEEGEEEEMAQMAQLLGAMRGGGAGGPGAEGGLPPGVVAVSVAWRQDGWQAAQRAAWHECETIVGSTAGSLPRPFHYVVHVARHHLVSCRCGIAYCPMCCLAIGPLWPSVVALPGYVCGVLAEYWQSIGHLAIGGADMQHEQCCWTVVIAIG